MESLSQTIFQYLHAIWRRKWLTAIAAWAVCIVGWSVVIMLPSRFESMARVYVDADGLLTPLLRGLAVDVDQGQQLDVLQRTLVSRSNLEQLLHLADLDARVKTAADKDAALQSLVEAIAIKPQTRNLFTISFQHSDPVVARNVVRSLLTIFAESTTGTARSQMDNAQRFLNDQIAVYEQQLRAAEQRRAGFRTQHSDVLAGGGAPALDTVRTKIEQLRLEMQDTAARRDALQKELNGLPAFISVDSAASIIINNGRTATTTEQRLEDAQRQLDELRSRYTDQHPDVAYLKTQIAELRAQVTADRTGRTQGTGGADASSSGLKRAQVSNPVYEQVKIRLVEAESNLASLQRRVKDAEADQQRLQALVQASPNVEVQAQDMDRDYNVLKRNYEELLARRESTNLAQAADTKADKIQFRVVDAPQVPTAPVAPNRPLLFSAVLVAGLLGGLSIPILLAQLDRSFATLGRLRSLGLPVLGGVSYVAYVKSRGQALIETAGFGATAVALVMLYGVLIAMSIDLHRILSRSVV